MTSPHHRRTPGRHLVRGLGATGVVLAAFLGTATPASAHNTLVGSSPAENASVDAGPAQVELTFDQPVQDGEALNSVVVVGPDGAGQWQDGGAVVASNVVTVKVRPLGPAGLYRIGYRVLSADGHSISGEIPFTLTKPGTGTPAAAVADAGTPAGAADTGLPTWVWIAGAAVLLAAGLVVALRMGGREDSKAK